MQQSHVLKSKPGRSGRCQDAFGCQSPSRHSRKGALQPELATEAAVHGSGAEQGLWPGDAPHLPERWQGSPVLSLPQEPRGKQGSHSQRFLLQRAGPESSSLSPAHHQGWSVLSQARWSDVRPIPAAAIPEPRHLPCSCCQRCS